MTKNEKAGVSCIVALALLPVGAFAKGLVLVKLWAWFIIPLFHLPPLSIAAALGLSLLISYLTTEGLTRDTNEGTSSELVANAITRSLVVPAFVLLLGYIFKQFV